VRAARSEPPSRRRRRWDEAPLGRAGPCGRARPWTCCFDRGKAGSVGSWHRLAGRGAPSEASKTAWFKGDPRGRRAGRPCCARCAHCARTGRFVARTPRNEQVAAAQQGWARGRVSLRPVRFRCAGCGWVRAQRNRHPAASRLEPTRKTLALRNTGPGGRRGCAQPTVFLAGWFNRRDPGDTRRESSVCVAAQCNPLSHWLIETYAPGFVAGDSATDVTLLGTMPVSPPAARPPRSPARMRTEAPRCAFPTGPGAGTTRSCPAGPAAAAPAASAAAAGGRSYLSRPGHPKVAEAGPAGRASLAGR
jgi:hypothetical protein